MTGVLIGPVAFGRSPRTYPQLLQGYRSSAGQSVGNILIKALAFTRRDLVVACASSYEMGKVGRKSLV